jgi:alkaline phosphatase D
MRLGRNYKQMLRLLSFLLFLEAYCWPQSATVIHNSEHAPNSPNQVSKHYVVLVSLDGFRYDYTTRYRARPSALSASKERVHLKE